MEEGRMDGRPLAFTRGKKPGGGSVEGMEGRPLQVRMPRILSWLLHIQFWARTHGRPRRASRALRDCALLEDLYRWINVESMVLPGNMGGDGETG